MHLQPGNRRQLHDLVTEVLEAAWRQRSDQKAWKHNDGIAHSLTNSAWECRGPPTANIHKIVRQIYSLYKTFCTEGPQTKRLQMLQGLCDKMES